jgi:uncharacterized protein YcaQ
MGSFRKQLVSFMNELTERLNLDREEMKNRLSDLEVRFNALEARLEAIANRTEANHADIWALLEAQHKDSSKLLTEILQVLPMAVSMSTSEVLVKLTDSIKADIADSRQEIVGKISVANVDPT